MSYDSLHHIPQMAFTAYSTLLANVKLAYGDYLFGERWPSMVRLASRETFTPIIVVPSPSFLKAFITTSVFSHVEEVQNWKQQVNFNERILETVPIYFPLYHELDVTTPPTVEWTKPLASAFWARQPGWRQLSQVAATLCTLYNQHAKTFFNEFCAKVFCDMA